jgi:hypothetical protein
MLAGSMAGRVTPHYARRRSSKDQAGAEDALGEEEDRQAQSHDLTGGQEADRGAQRARWAKVKRAA